MNTSATHDTLPSKTAVTSETYETQAADIAIIGSGPAGASAALNAVARHRSCIMLSSDIIENPLYRAPQMNNIPGLPSISGKDLLEKTMHQVHESGVPVLNGRVLTITPGEVETETHEWVSGFYLTAGERMVQARTVILATGIFRAKRLPGEAEYLGKGVSYCATCDGMFFRERRVSVLAYSKESLHEAEHLSRIGCKVTLFVRSSDLKRWDATIDDGLYENIVNMAPFEIQGDDGVVKALLCGKDLYPSDGIFILRDAVPPDQLLPDLQYEGAYIAVDKHQATNIPGIFAAGDCTGEPLQVAPAFGEGLIAALSADAYLRKK